MIEYEQNDRRRHKVQRLHGGLLLKGLLLFPVVCRPRKKSVERKRLTCFRSQSAEQCDISDPGSERCSGARRAAGTSRIQSDQTERSEVPPHVFPLLQKSGDMLSITDRYQHFTYR